MTAEPREELLSAYLDDELSASERAQVEQWLAESAEYRQLYEELRAVRHDLQSLPRHKLAEDLGPAVLRRAERAVLAGRSTPPASGDVTPGSTLAQWWSRGSSRRMFFWPAVAVAAALMVVLFDTRQDGEREIARKTDDAAPADDLRASTRSGKTDSAFRSASEAPSPTALPQSKAERDDVGQAVESAVKKDVDAPTDGARKASRMRDAPAEATAGAPLEPLNAPAAPAAGEQAANSVKLESNVRRALANRAQVNFIQADVSPDFVAENQMEKVLTDNKVKFQRYALLAVDEKDPRARLQTKDKQQQPELSYSLEASPEQVEGIVTQLEREQSRRRVSNLAVGLQLDAAAKVGSLGDKVEQAKPADALYSKKQQPVTIYLFWQQNAAKAAAPAKP